MDVTFATEARSPTTSNEDWIGATTDVVVLLDGVSTPPGLDVGCSHGTRWYVRSLGTKLLHEVTTRPERPLAEALRDSISSVASSHAHSCDLAHTGSPSATVAILRTTAVAVDYLVLSDTSIALDTGDDIHVVSDERIMAAAPELRAATYEHPIGSEQHALNRRAMVEQQRRRRNVPGGYWVAAASPEAADEAVTGSVPRARVHRAAVLSDGAAAVVDYELADWKALLDILEQAGPADVIRRVREAETSDPVGRRWPRTKVSDDATVAYCRIAI